VVKRRLLQNIIDTLKSGVFSAFPDLPLERMLAGDPHSASASAAPSTTGASASSFHWGMFGSTLGIAHLGDALESIGDGAQLQRWQALCAGVLRMQLSGLGLGGAAGAMGKQRESAGGDEGTIQTSSSLTVDMGERTTQT
jgi:hypothetical protein